MPCEQCEEGGKYKWGENGECKYETLEDCQLDNQDAYLEETLKPKSDKPIDWAYNFTKEQMNELHEEGELVIEMERDDKEALVLLFTYNEEKEEEEERIEMREEQVREYAKLTIDMLDDELDEYIDKLTASIKKI